MESWLLLYSGILADDEVYRRDKYEVLNIPSIELQLSWLSFKFGESACYDFNSAFEQTQNLQKKGNAQK